MKQYLTIVLGGLVLIFGGLGISYGAGMAWRTLPSLHVTQFSWHVPHLSFTVPPIPRYSFWPVPLLAQAGKITYTATDEEDAITSAAQSLPQSGITAKAYIIKDLDTGNIIAEHNSTQLLPIASLTKLVTAAVAKKLIKPDEHIVITHDIMNTFGNTASFRNGEIFRASDIYYPLLMVSSNDAAEALAQTYGRTAFIKAMNEFAQSIGAYRTYFADPSGLSPLNESTAADMVTIADWLRVHDPEIWGITLLKSKTIGSHTWDNPTHFLNWSNYVGGKNGYIPESDRTGVALFDLGQNGPNKRTYAVVVLGSSYRDGDVLKLLGKVK